MTEVEKLKRKMGYEDDVPRCRTCRAYRKERWLRDEDLSVHQPPFCAVGRFPIQPLACCDRWIGKKGESLG